MSSSERDDSEPEANPGPTLPEKKKKKKKRKRKRESDALEECTESTTGDFGGTKHNKRKKARLADSPSGETSPFLVDMSFHQRRYYWLMEEMIHFASEMGKEDGSLSSSTSDEEDDEMTALHNIWPIKKLKEMRDRGEISQWRERRWSLPEMKRLIKNTKKYMKVHGVVHICDVLDKEKHEHPEFYQSLARGIRRPVFLVYRKVRSLFNAANYNGRWTPEQDKELLRLQKIHGRDWSKLGLSLGVAPQAVRDHFRQITKTAIRKGPWTRKEERRLTKAVRRLQRYYSKGDNETEDEGKARPHSLPAEATWDQVAARVKTRTELQCRHKWVLGRMSLVQETTKKWQTADSAQLLCRLRDLEVEDEEEVDWSTLAQGWQNARSASFLRFKWALLKRSIPGYLSMTFHESLSYLLKHRLLAMREQS